MHDRLFVGVAALGDRSLMVEVNGHLGVTDEAMLPVARARTVVSHFRDVNGVDHFRRHEDGEVRLHDEPLCPFPATGPAPTNSPRRCGRRDST